MKRAYIWVFLAALGIVPILGLQTGLALYPNQNKPAPVITQTKPLSSESDEDRNKVLEQAVLQAVRERQGEILAFLVHDVLVDNFRYSPDGSWAAAWMSLADPETGENLPSEPGLALALSESDRWRVILPSDPGWLESLEKAPESLIPEDEKQAWLDMYQQHVENVPMSALTGYLLPWAKGERKSLSRSVGHDKDITSGSAHFSFDFYQSGQMWNIYASKAGTVWRIKNDTPTCYQYHCGIGTGNYLVLRDDTTDPVSYQLYLHLAYNSIPPGLMTVGAPVRQGQFIGVADNTGQSWGHHLHFQVHTNPTSYWGVAVDITFMDVPINGGRPRVSPADPPYCRSTDVCVAFQNSYVSGNTIVGDITPPVGDLVSPKNGETITANNFQLAGWASDTESGLYSVQFMAKGEGAWFEIGPAFTSHADLYNFDWNMCDYNVPNGPVSVAMRLVDNGGNQNQIAGLKHFNRAAAQACPLPPPCVPGSERVALYTRPDYQNCVLFSVGDYPKAIDLGNLGNNTAAAIQVGENVLANLYINSDFMLRGETFTAADASLADNLIGRGTLSSLQVWPRSQPVLTPTVVFTQNLTTTEFGDLVTLVWENAGGAVEYQVQYTLQGKASINSPWISTPYLSIPALEPGSYSWKVRGRNSAGLSAWSSPAFFEITSTGPLNSLASPFTAPYTDDMETSSSLWTRNGLWAARNNAQLAYSGTMSWWFQGSGGDYDRNGMRSWGDLTSPPISIPGPGYSLRFWYRNDTEGSGLHWDQRWIQISVDNGPFQNIHQLSDDPLGYWLQSPFIDLSAYAGRTIRVRFRFDTIDSALNVFKGWGIDDFSITASMPEVCPGEDEPNNNPEQAIPLNFGAVHSAHICPPGDVDYYKFSAVKGDQIVIDIEANSARSHLDPIVYLYDSDGVSLLAEHDDRVPNVQLDPILSYLINRSGIYYIKVKAWDHPSEGGSEDFYKLKLIRDSQPPSISLLFPTTGSLLPEIPINIIASASDSISGVSRVEFYWHNSYWLEPNWKLLAIDNDGSNGWSVLFDPSVLDKKDQIAFYARAYDWAGNSLGAGAWNIDFTAKVPRVFLPLIQK